MPQKDFLKIAGYCKKFEFLDIKKKMWTTESQTDKTERNLLTTVSFPKYPKQAGLDQAEAGVRNSVQVSHMDGRGPAT